MSENDKNDLIFSTPYNPLPPEKRIEGGPSYINDGHYIMSARGLQACMSTPDNPVPLESVVDGMIKEMVNCHDTGYDTMLTAQSYILNGLLTVMIERGMVQPDPFNTSISAALRAQKQFQDIARTRSIKSLESIAKEKWDDKKGHDFCKQNEHKWK
jgi:hypothetical protein